MSMENVKEFLALVKTDEGLARKVVELKDNLQKSANLGSEVEILAEKVLPLAKAHGLEFTAEEFLAYANSVSGELSDDDLLNVSGGISARGVALGLLFATGLSFVPTIVSSFAIGGGSAPETSISQSYNAGDSLQQDDEIDVDAAEDNQVSPQLQAAREKVERLQQELSRKKRGKSTVSKGYMKAFQELEKARANVERLEKIETEKNKKQFSKVMTELLEAKKDQQEDMGVALGDNQIEENVVQNQTEMNAQVENKEDELEKKDEVVEEKKEEKKEEVAEEDVVEEAVEEKKDEVAEEKKEDEKAVVDYDAAADYIGGFFDENDDQSNAGVNLGDNKMEENVVQNQTEMNAQVENKEDELEKKDEVVEEKKEEKKEEVAEEVVVEEAVEEKKDEVAEEKKEDEKAVVDYDAAADYIGGFFDENDDQSNAGVNLGDNKMEEKHEEANPQEVSEIIEEVVDEEKDNIIEQQQEDKQSVEEKLVNEIQTNGSIKWTGTMVFVDYKKLAVGMKNSGFFDLKVNQQKDIYQNAVRTVLSTQNAEPKMIDSRLIAADDDIQQAKNAAESNSIVGKGETGKITYEKLPLRSGSFLWSNKDCIDHIVNQVPGATEDISNFTLDKFDEVSQTNILKDISWLFSKKNADQIFAGDSSINKDTLNKLAEIDAKYNYRSDQSSSWDKIMENINKGLDNWDTLTADAKETLKKDINYVCSKMGKANGTYYLGNMIGSSSYGWNTKEPNEENEELELLVRLQNDGFSDVTATKEAHAQTTRYVSNHTGKLREKMDRVMGGIKDWKDGKLLEASVDELKKDIEHLGGYIYTDKDKNPYLWALRDSYGYDSSSKRASNAVETKKAKVLQALKNANYDIANESVQEALYNVF